MALLTRLLVPLRFTLSSPLKTGWVTWFALLWPFKLEQKWLASTWGRGNRKQACNPPVPPACICFRWLPEKCIMTEWLKTTENHSLWFGRLTVQNQGVNKAMLPRRSLGRNLPLTLPGSGPCWPIHGSPCLVEAWLQSLPRLHVVVSWCVSSVSFCQGLPCHFLIGMPVIRFGAHPRPGWPHLKLITSTKTLLANKAPQPGTKGENLNIAFGRDAREPVLPCSTHRGGNFLSLVPWVAAVGQVCVSPFTSIQFSDTPWVRVVGWNTCPRSSIYPNGYLMMTFCWFMQIKHAYTVYLFPVTCLWTVCHTLYNSWSLVTECLPYACPCAVCQRDVWDIGHKEPNYKKYII